MAPAPRVPPTLVLLAAGMGSRYGGVKQLEAVGPGGATLMDYSIYDALRAGFRKIVFIIRPDLEEAFQATILPRYAGQATVATAHQRLDALPAGMHAPAERTKPWGTGQAVLAAEGAVDGPFVVANADDFYGAPAFAATAEFLRHPQGDGAATFALVGYRLKDTLSEHGAVNRGACVVDHEGWLGRVEEIYEIAPSAGGKLMGRGTKGHVELSPDALVSMNLWAFYPSIFPILRAGFVRFLQDADARSEFLLPAAVQEALTRGVARVRVLDAGSPWFGMTYPADRPRVEQAVAALVRSGVYPERLWS
ncbi:MAG TPA: sugar phosphate nucleotidyltransferase [Gemmatimonadales bacterium]|nr:sugar phosphate nucleotidyltransferase [Gemmatimonadales bacterium]